MGMNLHIKLEKVLIIIKVSFHSIECFIDLDNLNLVMVVWF